jgi:hypothetical protein
MGRFQQANFVPHVTYCEYHQKKAFMKAAAKQAIRNMADRKGMREYRCGLLDDLWHVGHLPQVVLDGELSATDVYGPRVTPVRECGPGQSGGR